MVLNIGPTRKLAHIGGVQAAFADGSVRFLSETLAPEIRRAVISINGKEVVGEF
jgi:prepilin-type processing-associated H-X9-DG protein